MDTKALKQKILDLAIKGKLVPQDPNDEPASVLLEKIRAEKMQMVKDGKLKSKDLKNDTVIFVGEDNLHYEKFSDGTIKCLKDDIPFHVPESWSWSRLGICLDVRDGTHDTPKYHDKGIPLITSKNLQNGYINMTDVKFISHEDHKAISLRSKVDDNDILFAMIGTIGNPVHYHGNATFSIKNIALFKYIPNGLLMEYVYIWLLLAQDLMKKSASGGLQSFVSLKYLREFFIPVPPLNEQKKIVKEVSLILNFIDCLNINQNNIKNLIDKAKSKILDLAIRGKLVQQNPNDEPASILLERIRKEREELIMSGKLKRDKRESVIFRGEDNSYYEKFIGSSKTEPIKVPFDLPKGWVWARGRACLSEMTNTIPTGVYFDYIDIDSIDNREHKITKPKHLNVSDAPSRAKRAVYTGSVLFSLVRPYLQNIARVSEKHKDCIASTGFYICNSNGVLSSEYLFYLMISPYVINGLNQFMKGDNSPSINRDDIENWLYPIPPLEEQKRITCQIEKLLVQITKITSAIK